MVCSIFMASITSSGAPADGVVGEVLYGVGEQVGEGAQLLSFEAGNG